MPTKKSIEERAVRINISLLPKTLKAIDANVELLQNFAISKGVERKEVEKAITRSSLIKQMVDILGSPTGLFAVKAGLSAAFGIDASQTDLFEDGECVTK